MSQTRITFGLLVALAACGPGGDTGRDPQGKKDLSVPGDLGMGVDGRFELDDLTINGDFPIFTDDAALQSDPKTCDEAATSQSYLGCDYWPTVTSNSVWSIFDFGVVVANAGDQPTMVTVTGPNSVSQMTTVPPNSLVKLYLPWVPSLKGLDMDQCASPVPLLASVHATRGAYHLVSSLPVIVYQFNALEYKGGGANKNWSACPGSTTNCNTSTGPRALGCFSFTNDASLLLPSTAMTGHYRVTGQHGETGLGTGGGLGAYLAVTGITDDTSVTVKVSMTGNIIAGGGLTAVAAGGSTTFILNSGDVMELLADPNSSADLSGSLVTANHPVQVIVGNTCSTNPSGTPACDHLESALFPAETLGQHYIVTVPTAPNGDTKGATVRIYGNADNTQLVYNPPLASAPALINAGQVVDLGVVSGDFEVKGSHEFAVAIFQLGGSIVDPKAAGDTTPSKGDPSQSLATAVEQYRIKYVFLAPDDYDVSFGDVQAPMNARLTLDGAPVTQTWTAIGTSGFGVVRIPLGAGNNGAHLLTSDVPVGLQVMGYGSYTSYQVPGGVNLVQIAPPPIQ